MLNFKDQLVFVTGYRVFVNSRYQSRLDSHISPPILFGVVDNLSIHVFGNLSGEAHSHTDDFLRVETR
jgi:hypothetical protein